MLSSVVSYCIVLGAWWLGLMCLQWSYGLGLSQHGLPHGIAAFLMHKRLLICWLRGGKGMTHCMVDQLGGVRLNADSNPS